MRVTASRGAGSKRQRCRKKQTTEKRRNEQSDCNSATRTERACERALVNRAHLRARRRSVHAQTDSTALSLDLMGKTNDAAHRSYRFDEAQLLALPAHSITTAMN
ncbi:MAG: Uncharacterized protein conserved in bacteria [uncultured Paraburkholderia sp.]|nr:MAG: Uncharacterized protein conserved in bacteria [uncultured Paraburkholderia sp.]